MQDVMGLSPGTPSKSLQAPVVMPNELGHVANRLQRATSVAYPEAFG
jgi:hypothetical protein